MADDMVLYVLELELEFEKTEKILEQFLDWLVEEEVLLEAMELNVLEEVVSFIFLCARVLVALPTN